MDNTLPRTDEVRPVAGADPDELTRRIAELEARIDELERERAADVERLHTAQAALANTQVELLRASARAKGVQARTAAPEERRAPEEPAVRAVPPRPDVAGEATSAKGSVDDALRRRIARFQDDLHAYRESFAAPPTEVVVPPERHPGSDASVPDRRVDRDPHESRSRNGSEGTANAPPSATDEPGSDGDRLSLRQRLASAANARHQVALSEGVNERREATSASAAIPPPP